jgi:hypothetical protein
MHRLLILIAFCLTGFVGLAYSWDEKAPVEFTSLNDACEFIDNALDHSDWKKLADSLYPQYNKGEPNRDHSEHLKQARGDKKLSVIFANEDFPAKDDVFSMGNCMIGPIPHAHIDFVRVGSFWRITRFWKCR